MSERRSLDRLLLPKMRVEPDGVEPLVPESSAPMPRWQTLPLDAKFPVIPAAKDEVTFVTTKICQPAYRSSQHETFDLTDPYNRTIQTEYHALRDPYLKDWLAKPHVRKQLLEQNLVTPSGKVPCTVRDFNNYRNFLRRQALIKSKEPETVTRATENRNLILRKTKMKAELVSVELKCKRLKAQQMLKEAEEEKQQQFWRKQAAEIEREQKRLEEEKKSHDELVKKRREKWIEKQKEIREREENTRREHEQKVLKIEMGTQEKLNKVDTMRQFKQHLLEARRRQQWHEKRQYQKKVLEQAMVQQRRVKVEMEMRRRQYEYKMTSSLVKYQDASGDTAGVDDIMRTVQEDGAKFTTGQQNTQMVHQKSESDINLSRRCSMWILEELLYSCGMIEGVNLLFGTRTPQEYSRVLDELVGSVMRTARGSTVLGVEQDSLSKILHLVVRQLEEAYHRKEQRKRANDTAISDDAEAECMKRFFTGMDTSLESEKAQHISMLATLDMDCKFALDKSTSGSRPDRLSQHDERALLFYNHLRLPDSEVREMEVDLTRLLMHFQKSVRTQTEQKQVLELFLRLACQDFNVEGETEQNNDTSTLASELSCPNLGSNDGLLEEAKLLSLQKGSGTLVNNCMKTFQLGGEERPGRDANKVTESEGQENGDISGGNNSNALGEVVRTETNPHGVKIECSITATEKALCNSKHSLGRSDVKDGTQVEPASSMHMGSELVTNEVGDFVPKQTPSAEHVAVMTNSEHEFYSTTHDLNGPPALTCETLEPINFTKEEEECLEMQLPKEAMQGDKGVARDEINEVESGVDKEWQSTYQPQIVEGEYSQVVDTELHCSSTIQTISDLSVPDQAVNTTYSPTQETTFQGSGRQGDIVSMAAQFVMEVQQRRLKGIGFPPAKIHYIISTFLSGLWRSSHGDTAHKFGTGLYSPDVARTVASLIYNVKTTRLPQELINNLTRAIVKAVLHNLVDFKSGLPEGIVKTTVQAFARQVEKGQVSVRILEDVLFGLQEEFGKYLRSSQSLGVNLFLVQTLSIAEELLSKGKVLSNDFVKNILDYTQLSRQNQVTLIYSSWMSMLRQAKVAIQLSAISPQDRTQLEYLVLVCGETLTDVVFDNVTQCLEQLRSRMGDEAFKMRSAVTLSASVVGVLLQTVQEKRISGLTLLPGALTSRSLLSPCALGQDSTGEVVVLLTLDSLARDMGEDTLDRQCLGHIAASLVDLLTRDYSYQSEALEGEGLAGGLDCMTSRFRCKSLEFTDSCIIMSAILRPYLGCLLTDDGDPSFKVDFGEPVCVDEDLLPSLFDFITEVFVAFVRGMIARMRKRWVGNHLHDDLLVLYVWRTIANLAKEANKLLCYKNATDRSQKTSFKGARWNLSVLVGLVESFKRKSDEHTLCSPSDGCSETHRPGEKCLQDRTERVQLFLACMSRRLPEPGYVPVPDLCISNQATSNDSVAATISKAIKEEAIPADVEEAARNEVISACKNIFESLVSAEALHKMRNKLASHVAGAVFVINRLAAIVSNKMWSLKEGLSRNSLTVNDLIPCLVNCQGHVLMEIVISKEDAFRILTMFILELETIQRAVAVLSKIVDRLTRISQHPAEANSHASNILSVISSSALTQFIRAFIVHTLKMVAWLLDKICYEKGSASMAAPLSVYSSDVTKLAIAVVCDGIKFLKKATHKEAKAEDGRAPRNDAGHTETSLLRIPKEVYDNVFGCVVDIIETVGSTDNNTEMDIPSPSDMVAFLINQVLTSVSSFADIGKYHFICINDLLLPDLPSKSCNQIEAVDAFVNNAAMREKPDTCYLLTSLEQKESEYLLQRLIQIITCIRNIIKQEINDAVLVNEPCDSLMQAFAFMNVKLGKAQHDLAKKCVTLTSQESSVSSTNADRKSSNAKSGVSECEKSVNKFHNEIQKGDVKKIRLSEYIENLLHNVTNVNETNKGLNIHPAQVIKAILKACYSIDVNYLVSGSAANHTADFTAQSVILVEIMIGELYNRLAELEKARTKEIDKETNYPYLFSRTYTMPDPWGPYYSDVAVRARQLTDTVRIGGVTRSQVQRLSAVSSLIHSKDEILLNESSRGDKEMCSAVGEEGGVGSDGVQTMRQSHEGKRQTRAATWRLKVQDCSSVHNTENTLKLWVRNEIKMSQKMSALQKKSMMNSTGKQISNGVLTSADNDVKVKKVNHEDSQTTKDLPNQVVSHKESMSAQNIDQKSTRSSIPLVKSVPPKVFASKMDDPSKQQIKQIQEKIKDSLKDTKNSSSKTCGEMRETAAQKHVSRIARNTRVKPKTKYADVGGSNVWPRTVHIIHHAYIEKSKPVEPNKNTENKAALACIDESPIQTTEEHPKENQTKPQSQGLSELKDEHPPDQQQSAASKRVLVSLLEKELPQQITALARCLGKDAVDALGNAELANVLSFVDLSLAELDQGDELQAVHVLEADCEHGKVSQRVMEAINNLLRSVTSNSISDEEIKTILADVATESQIMDIDSFRQKLIASLSVMAERVEEGSKAPVVFSGRQAEVLDALHYIREVTQSIAGTNKEGVIEEDNDNYESDGGSSAAEGHSPGCKTNRDSPSASCNTALTSVSASDDDSNDDKCIISSSWTVLSSCPSLSSSRTSDLAHAKNAEDAAQSKHGSQQRLQKSVNAECVLESGKEGQLSKIGIADDVKDGSQPVDQDSMVYSDFEGSSRKDVEYGHEAGGQFSYRSPRAYASVTSQERQLSDKSLKAEADTDDHEDWSVSEHSIKTGSGNNGISGGQQIDNLPTAGRPDSQNENRPASGLTSWSSSPKSSRCSSARTPRNEVASSIAHSLSSISTTSTRSGKHKDRRTPSRSSRSDVSVDNDEATQSAADRRVVRSRGLQDRESSTDSTLDASKSSHELSQEHNEAGGVTMDATDQYDPFNDRYSSDHDSCASEEDADCEYGTKMNTGGVVDLRAGGDFSGDGVSDVDEYSEMG